MNAERNKQPPASVGGFINSQKTWQKNIQSTFDITEIFKTKGDLKRWSAKRTVGGVIALTACNDIIAHGITWPAVVLCAVAVTPLCLSFAE